MAGRLVVRVDPAADPEQRADQPLRHQHAGSAKPDEAGADSGRSAERQGHDDRSHADCIERDLQAAARAGWRSRWARPTGAKSTSTTRSTATTNADVPGLGGSIASQPETARNIWAIFGEINIPILKNLEANVAVRYDDYQNVGNTTNPKVSLRWQPTKEILLRGSAGTGSARRRCPSCINRPRSARRAASTTTRCVAPQTGSPRVTATRSSRTKLGGNPLLSPEKSTSYTAGLVLEPVPGFSMGAEYFYIKVKDAIGTPSENADLRKMVAFEAGGLLFRYDRNSVGCAGVPANLPCPVNFGVQTNFNINQLTTSGIDVNVTLDRAEVRLGQPLVQHRGHVPDPVGSAGEGRRGGQAGRPVRRPASRPRSPATARPAVSRAGSTTST
jgi:hypothetical protein